MNQTIDTTVETVALNDESNAEEEEDESNKAKLYMKKAKKFSK